MISLQKDEAGRGPNTQGPEFHSLTDHHASVQLGTVTHAPTRLSNVHIGGALCLLTSSSIFMQISVFNLIQRSFGTVRCIMSY